MSKIGVVTDLADDSGDWTPRSLGEFFKFKNGLNKAKQYFGAGTPIVNYMDVYSSPHIRANDIAGRVTVTPTEIENFSARKGDVFFTRTSETVEEIGMASVALDDLANAVFSGFVLRARPKSKTLDSLFIGYALRSEPVRRQIGATASYTTRALTNGRLLSAVRLGVPPFREQKAIAAALSDADALIEALEDLIAKKRGIKQGAMQELLTPRSRWVELRLGASAQLKARIGWQGLTTSEYLDSGNYHLVTGTDFKGGFIDWDDCHFVEKRRYNQDKYIQLRENDVLVTKDGTIGKVAFIDHLPKPATLNSGVFVIRPLANAFRPMFFYYLLMSPVFDDFLAKLSAGSTINHLYQKDFVGFSFSVPPTDEEQDEIASTLLNMDHEIQATEARLAKARQIKQGMMQELLTGRVRLV